MSGAKAYRKAQRLDRRTITALLKSGRPKREGDLSLLSQANRMKFARFGVIVPKRLVARAVDRNRARRLLREWFRQNQDRFTGRDLLLRVRARPEDLRALVHQFERMCLCKS